MAKIGIDIDEVLRTLVPKMVKLYNVHFNDSMTFDDIKEYDVDQSFPKIKERTGESASKWFFQEHGHELFYESPAIEGAVEAVKRLKELGNEIYIISYQKTMNNKIDTLNWLVRWGIEYDGICFVKDKTVVHLDYIIDDNDWNFIKCNCKHGVLITAPYNRNICLDLLHKVSNCEDIQRSESLSEFVTKFEKYEK